MHLNPHWQIGLSTGYRVQKQKGSSLAITTMVPKATKAWALDTGVQSAWSRLAMLAFALALLYPLAGLGTGVGPWRWDGIVPGSTSLAAWNSIFLTGIALVIDVVLGTPVAYYLARSVNRDRIVWEAVVLISVLMPPL